MTDSQKFLDRPMQFTDATKKKYRLDTGPGISGARYLQENETELKNIVGTVFVDSSTLAQMKLKDGVKGQLMRRDGESAIVQVSSFTEVNDEAELVIRMADESEFPVSMLPQKNLYAVSVLETERPNEGGTLQYSDAITDISISAYTTKYRMRLRMSRM